MSIVWDTPTCALRSHISDLRCERWLYANKEAGTDWELRRQKSEHCLTPQDRRKWQHLADEVTAPSSPSTGRSDAAWKHAHYAKIWEYLRDDFEMDERFESLDFKLNIIQVGPTACLTMPPFPHHSESSQSHAAVPQPKLPARCPFLFRSLRGTARTHSCGMSSHIPTTSASSQNAPFSPWGISPQTHLLSCVMHDA